jgi:hypothetical protein
MRSIQPIGNWSLHWVDFYAHHDLISVFQNLIVIDVHEIALQHFQAEPHWSGRMHPDENFTVCGNAAQHKSLQRFP